MKRKSFGKVKRAVFGLMTALLLMPGIKVYAEEGEHDGRLTDRTEHTDKKFDEWEYSRMDKADFDKIVENIDETIADTANSDAVLDIIVGMEDYINEVGRNYGIAHINSDLVADDKYWDDEVQFYSDLATDVSDAIQVNYRKIAESPCFQVLKDRVTEEEWEDILDYEEMTQEQKDLDSKETELSLKFDVLSQKEYKTTVNGKQYTSEELAEEYGAGNMELAEYMTADAEILKLKNEEFGQLYLELVDIRNKLAKSYGYDNYADYAYDKIYERDYKPEELDEYRQGVKDYLVPFKDEMTMLIYGEHYEEMSNLYNETRTEQECLDTLREYLPKISSDLLVSLDFMEDRKAYDLSVDSKKAPGGYTTAISGYNAPYMYNCAGGNISDMETLIHEFGHYNQMYYMTEDSWYYGKTNIDLAEIHSQGLELLFMDFADDIYGDQADIMKMNTIFQLAYAAIEGVKEDEFQYRVYTNADGITLDDINKMYYDVSMEYGGNYAYMYSNSLYYAMSGYMDKGVNYDWIAIHHTFQSPMYYISYSTSVAAVFELFDVILDDRDEGIDTYLALVDKEFQDDFQETIEEVGLNNPIKTPRFDLYADDLGYAVGLLDERTVYKDYPEHENTTYWGEARPKKESVSEADDDDDEDEEKPEATEDDGEKEERGRASKKDADEEGMSTVLKVFIVIAVVLLIGMIIAIILLITSSNKKKKAAANTAAQPVPGMPQTPQYQAPQYQAPQYQTPQYQAPVQQPADQQAQPVQYQAPVQNVTEQPVQYQAPVQNVTEQPVQYQAPVQDVSAQPVQPAQPQQEMPSWYKPPVEGTGDNNGQNNI